MPKYRALIKPAATGCAPRILFAEVTNTYTRSVTTSLKDCAPPRAQPRISSRSCRISRKPPRPRGIIGPPPSFNQTLVHSRESLPAPARGPLSPFPKLGPDPVDLYPGDFASGPVLATESHSISASLTAVDSVFFEELKESIFDDYYDFTDSPSLEGFAQTTFTAVGSIPAEPTAILTSTTFQEPSISVSPPHGLPNDMLNMLEELEFLAELCKEYDSPKSSVLRPVGFHCRLGIKDTPSPPGQDTVYCDKGKRPAMSLCDDTPDTPDTPSQTSQVGLLSEEDSLPLAYDATVCLVLLPYAPSLTVPCTDYLRVPHRKLHLTGRLLRHRIPQPPTQHPKSETD
jgi:hypothetical protein